MSTPPFTVTPQIDAYIADQVAQAVAAERIALKDDFDRLRDELATANRLRRHWEEVATGRHDDSDRVKRIFTVTSLPLPRFGRGRAAQARLDQIARIIKESQS